MDNESSPTVKQALVALLTDDSFRKEVENLKSQPQALRNLIKVKGFHFTPEEWKAGLEATTSEELPESQLADISGGGGIINPRFKESYYDFLEGIYGGTDKIPADLLERYK